MTPHQGLMSTDVFAQALARAVEFREISRNLFDNAEVTVSMCGLGEPLLNRHAPSFVRQIREVGFRCELSSNASLLDERTGGALLNAGLQCIFVNAGSLDDDYEDVYALPFQRTRDNIARFVVMAANRCQVRLIIVNHRNDPERARAVESYWRELGIEHFGHYDLINRGGSLPVDYMPFGSHSLLGQAHELLRERGISPICGVAFRFLFVGYDGQYYLCSSDWEKRVPLGSVFHESFVSTMREKLRHVETREPICKTCCHDPVNRLARRLRDLEEGNGDQTTQEVLVEREAAADRQVRTIAEQFMRVPAL